MKYGYRTPSVKKSISSRTTGKINRAVKSATNPIYGKKGIGYINNPKKAVYNKIYNKTTESIFDENENQHEVSNERTSQDTVTIVAWIITIIIMGWLFSKMWVFIHWLFE